MSEYDFSGRTLNQRYELKRKIGAGAFATVYIAHDLRMYKRKVAIKVLNPERRLNPGNVDRFIQEVKVAAKLDGPYRDRVVKIIDQGRCDVAQPPLLYLVMEHVDGVTLQSLLRPTGPEQPRQPLPWTQAVSIVRELLKALGTLHDCGVVHRDIKPGNCILEQRPDGDYLKLLDLGIVKVLPGFEMSGDHPRTQPEFVLGTPRYMAPEQFGGPVSDPRVDLYSAGIMLYEFLTGDIPARWYEQPGAAHPYEPLPPSQVNPTGGIPPALDALVLKAIAFEPHKRFATAVVFAQALAELLHAGAPAKGRDRLRSAPTPAAAVVPAPAGPIALRVVPDLHDSADDGRDRVGPMLRWWTIVSTTCTAMVFVFAFAALLRRAESRPTLDLESDDTPAVVETSRVRAAAAEPVGAPTSAVLEPAAAAPVAAAGSDAPPVAELPPAEQPAAEPVPAPAPAPAPPPLVEAKPPPAEPAGTQPKKTRPPAPVPADEAGELMPVRPRSSLSAIEAAAQRDLQGHCGGTPRRSVTVLVRLEAATGKLVGVELSGPGVDAKLRQCVESRAGKAFVFDGLRERKPSYGFTMSL